MLKIIGSVLIVVVLVLGGGVAWLLLRKPAQRAPSAEKVERTPARVARGEYLVKHVSDCEGCHSDHDWDRFGCPVKPGTAFQGGYAFDEKLAVPGVVCAQNLTPDTETGEGRWSDGEIIRAFREGVSRDGHALFPMMPYAYYRSMSDEDARSVLVFLRSVQPIKHVIPASRIAFPVNLFIKFEPKPVDGPIETPSDAKDHHAYGQYLVTIAGCRECHSPHDDKGKIIPGRDFSGGWQMVGPWGRNVTPNVTPDPDTFVGRATKADFVGRFKSFETLTGTSAPQAAPGRNTIMPWLAMSGMRTEDLGAIYDYLKTLPPIANRVDPFPDAKSP